MIEGFAILGGNIDKIVGVTQERKQEHAKTTEAHLEISRMRLKAAQEEKEAKMLQVYDSLLHQDISQMTEESKARREKTLAMIEKKIFSNNNEVWSIFVLDQYVTNAVVVTNTCVSLFFILLLSNLLMW